MHLNTYFREQVEEALRFFNKVSMYPDPHELDTIKDMIEALDIVEAGSRHLSGQKETLASADEG